MKKNILVDSHPVDHPRRIAKPPTFPSPATKVSFTSDTSEHQILYQDLPTPQAATLAATAGKSEDNTEENVDEEKCVNEPSPLNIHLFIIDVENIYGSPID